MRLTHGGVSSYKNWRISVENGAPADNEFWNDIPYMNFDKIIFVGDYVDSYNLSNVDILHNLKEILWFKKSLPDKVVLLLGNHDIQYFIPNEVCSGYRGEMRPDLYDLFTQNKEFFNIAHSEEDKDGKKYLWTHAGVTKGWHTELLRDVNSPSYRHTDFFIGSQNWKIDKLINFSFELRVSNVFNVDAHSGGHDLWAGPLWVRPDILDEFCIEGINQIVGHTHQKTIRKVDLKTHQLYYIDCLEKEKEGLILEL